MTISFIEPTTRSFTNPMDEIIHRLASTHFNKIAPKEVEDTSRSNIGPSKYLPKLPKTMRLSIEIANIFINQNRF